ncbi:MAG: glycosyltransferase family protein, partial [Bacteroidota bacterium]|nr:glycosyltransferase family protein [Bacteroidota bacterium]
INTVYLERLKLNLAQTLGYPYELLVWDNHQVQKPITEVYNLLASRAQYPYWCFIHEDIRFETQNWGENLKKAFEENPATGLIGVAGAKYKSAVPSGWSTGLKEFDLCNIFHEDKDGHTQHIYMNPHHSVFEPVVNVDGVFMAIRKEVWSHAHFNEENLRGFHLYDIDFSFHVLKKWKAAVLFNIDIMHFTQGGNYGDEWVEPTISWHRLFSGQLPQYTGIAGIDKYREKMVAVFWLKRLSVEKISLRNKWKWIRAGKTWLDPVAWPFIGMFLIGRKLKRRPVP